jgi:hypothetical protein
MNYQLLFVRRLPRYRERAERAQAWVRRTVFLQDTDRPQPVWEPAKVVRVSGPVLSVMFMHLRKNPAIFAATMFSLLSRRCREMWIATPSSRATAVRFPRPGAAATI